MTTLLVTPEELAQSTVVVRGDAYRHLFRALRLSVGDGVRLVDGEGRTRASEVVEVSKDEARLVAGEPQPSREPDVEVSLWVAMLRPERASWLVEKTTELGVRRLVFYRSEFSQHRYNDRHHQRFERVARAALQQSGGAWLPRIVFADTPLHEAALARERVPDEEFGPRRVVVLDLCDGESKPAEVDPSPVGVSTTSASRTLLIVGPEGGFSSAERELLAQRYSQSASQAGAATWCRMDLGARILRVETAAVVGLARLLRAERT